MEKTSVRKPFRQYFKVNYALYLMSVPGLIYVIGYKFLPLIGLQLAFKDYDMFAGNGLLDSMLKSPWVGLSYFESIFGSDQFWRLLRNTVSISVLKIAILFPLPILLAVLMNEMQSMRFKRGVQTLIYLPHFLSWVIIHGIFSTLLSTNGVLNNFLTVLGQPTISPYTDSALFRPLLIFTEGWKETGWSAIVYLAALTAIDPQLYEAATVDGANRLQRMWHVTLPGILPVVSLMLLLRVGSILAAGTEQILAMYNPAVYDVADVLQTYIYRVGLGKMDFSTGTAMGLFESVIGFALTVGCNGLSKKFFGRSLW